MGKPDLLHQIILTFIRFSLLFFCSVFYINHIVIFSLYKCSIESYCHNCTPTVIVLLLNEACALPIRSRNKRDAPCVRRLCDATI